MKKRYTLPRRHVVVLALALAVLPSSAQDGANKVSVSGSVMSDILFPQSDVRAGAEETNDWAQTNTYADVNLLSKYVDAGARFEYTQVPLPGFEKDFRGWGVPYLYVKGKCKWGELTAGTFYEQFGSGFILRTYEERSLGIDNSLLGGRVLLKPVRGLTIKALAGKQRHYWGLNHSIISGADVEINLEEWVKKMEEHNVRLSIGASWVNRYEKDEEILVPNEGTDLYRLNLPTYVNAFDVRANLYVGDFSLLAEYAYKTQDPNDANGYIYRKGYVAMLSASYSKRGLSALVQVKRSDNMAFKSVRTLGDPTSPSSTLSCQPPFTMEHTYALAAMYPYATEPNGEWAIQAEVGYKFKRGTALGGRYGTSVKVNFSHVHQIAMYDADTEGGGMGSKGYGSPFWKWGGHKYYDPEEEEWKMDKGHTYYQDLNIQIEKKFSKVFQLNLMYMNQFYNQTLIEGEGGMVHSNIFVAEGKFQFNKKFTLRAEMQYLTTAGDDHDWLYALLELSMLPHWMFTVSDEYNVGKTDRHYYQAYVTFSHKAHRLQVGYGRTRAGYNCSGGVCRWIPATKGVTLSYNYNF